MFQRKHIVWLLFDGQKKNWWTMDEVTKVQKSDAALSKCGSLHLFLISLLENILYLILNLL